MLHTKYKEFTKIRVLKKLHSAIFSIVLTGCASMYNGATNVVTVYSPPEKASFIIKNEAGMQIHNGLTPASVTLKNGAGYFNGENYSVQYSKEGYVDAETLLDSSVSGWYWGNLFCGGLIGFLIIDPLTGGMYELPHAVTASLTKK